ncbi:MAG: LLM class flavin-dependent oxidoreductase [Acidimicrobiales bacterium]|nr:LLM class flavin-dependent oxidoreductase [Acidimicrobiales bacterium]
MPTDLRLGVHVGQQNLAMAELQALWRRLDQQVDWISAWDHFYEAPPAGGTLPHFETLTTLAALACATERTRIGVLVLYVGYRTPAVIARAATTLDHLSGGRFELGLGAGWHEEEARAFGYDFPSAGVRIDMLDEATRIIRGLLTRDRTSFEGRHFEVHDASCLPRPVQERLPIWLAGVGERRTLPLVAREADGWNATYVSPRTFARLNAQLDDHCAALGRDPATLRRGVNLSFNLAATATAAAAQRDALQAQWGELFELITRGSLLGTPDDAVEQVLAYRAAGADDINVSLRAPWDDEALEIYLTEVLPAVRAATAG